MKKRLRALHRNERGQIMIFGMLTILFVFVIGGLAVDYAHLFNVDDELEKSMDACCLAGAGKLGFDDTAFPAARAFATNFAEKNAYRAKGSIGTVTLNPNGNGEWEAWESRSTEEPYGEVVLGIWDPTRPDGVGMGQRFEPSLDGTRVNAVMCRYKTRLPTTLFSVWGHRFFEVGAMAVATANPPMWPPTSCIFPIGLSSCPFTTNEVYTSSGCGKAIKFVTSNQKGDSTNTAAWVNLAGEGTPSASALRQQIENIADGACENETTPAVNDELGTNNGMAADVFNLLRDTFREKFLESVATGEKYTVETVDGTPPYVGYGWEVYVPVLETECSAEGTVGAWPSPAPVVGWTRFVVTQAWDNTGNNKTKIGEGCVVENPDDDNTWPYCSMTKSELPGDLGTGASRSLFGVYSCGLMDTPPIPTPSPRSALATKLRLVR